MFDAGDATINLGIHRPSDIDADYLSEIFMRLFQSERNRDNPPSIWDLTITVCFYPVNLPAGAGVKKLPEALQHFKNKLLLLDDTGGRCLFKCLVMGMHAESQRELGKDPNWSKAQYASTLLREAMILQSTLGFDPDEEECSWETLDRFVEAYPEWRVYAVVPSGGPCNKGLWKGTEFMLPPEETRLFGKSIFVCYYDKHWYPIPHRFFPRFGSTSTDENPHTERCRQCFARRKEGQLSRHECPNRYHCRKCDTWMDSADQKESHTIGLHTNDFKCPNCNTRCGSQTCRDQHYSTCVKDKRGPHCHFCKQSYGPEDYLPDGTLNHDNNPLRCKPYRCKNNACKELTFTLDELKQHRDYICPLSKYKNKRRRDAEPEDEDGDEDLKKHWAWDIETFSYPKTILVGAPTREKVVKEQRVELIVACNLAGEFRSNDFEFISWAYKLSNREYAPTYPLRHRLPVWRSYEGIPRQGKGTRTRRDTCLLGTQWRQIRHQIRLRLGNTERL